MGFRFRKSIKIAPGVRVNIGKKGSSVSIGGKGATVNVSKKGTRTTVGIPGTGISYSKTLKHQSYSSTPQTYSKGEYTFMTVCFVFLTFAGLFLGKPVMWIPSMILSALGIIVLISENNRKNIQHKNSVSDSERLRTMYREQFAKQGLSQEQADKAYEEHLKQFGSK
jgi:uncharacterized membrane protein